MRSLRSFGVVGVVLGVLLSVYGGAAAQWQRTNEPGFGIGSNTTASMVVFNDVLYAGTLNGGGLFKLGSPLDHDWFWWSQVDLPVGDVPGVSADFAISSIPALAVFHPAGARWPRLYVAVNGTNPSGERMSFVMYGLSPFAWEAEEELWTFNDHGEIVALTVFEDHLYVSLGDAHSRHRDRMGLYRTDGTTWEQVPTDSLALSDGDYAFGTFTIHDGALYAGTAGFNECPSCDRTAEVWRSEDGWRWLKHAELTSPTMAEIKAIASHGDALYVGTKNHAGEDGTRTGPELWRLDRDGAVNLTAERRLFPNEALHVDVLYSNHDVLYAGIGGAGHGRVYRSPDGERWQQITPEGITDPADDHYLVSSIAGVGEYVFFGTGFNNAEGTEVWRLASLRSDVGPCLGSHDSAPHLLHRVPDADGTVWETVVEGGVLHVLGPVHDEAAARGSAYASTQPTAFGYDHTGLLLRNQYLQLVYTAPGDDRVWTMRKLCIDGRTWTWEAPTAIDGIRTDRAPGATAHDWSGPTGPQLTIAYVDPDSQRIHFRVQEGTRWSTEYTLPDAARTANGPELVSFRGSLYCFYRGLGDDSWLYVARKTSNRASHSEWEVGRLPRAFTRPSTTDRAVSATVHDGAMIVAYVGHNNDYLWLRRSTDGIHWDRLGYIFGPISDQTPDLTSVGGTLYLAFLPAGDNELCLGTLEVDPENPHDTSGHSWRSSRPMACCPGCIRILEFFVPIMPLDDEDGGGEGG